MKAIKRLLAIPVFIGFLLSTITIVILIIVTWIPFGTKPTEWFIYNIFDEITDYLEKLA